jgi:glycosyltransferase involved in cell wall biosynthesis
LPGGGAELQTVLIARALADRGFTVRHIVLATNPLVAERDGVETIPLSESYGVGGLARRRAIFESLRQANAELYIQRSAGFGTGVVGVFTSMFRRRFVFSSSSEADFRLDRPTMAAAGASLDHWPTRMQYRLGLRLADAIVVQTETQLELARRRLKRRAVVIRSFSSVDPARADGQRSSFLWVGGFVDVKDPLSYVRLAKAVPEAEFRMLATDRGSAWSDLAAKVRTEAAAVPNLRMLSSRPRGGVLELYPQATALINTSRFEGFPNTFLEAWAHSTPVLSLRVDPDGVIANHGLGIAARGSLERLALAVRRYRQDQRIAAAAGARARAYVEQSHDPAIIGNQWAELIRSLGRNRR